MEAGKQLGDLGGLATLPGAQHVPWAPPASCGLLQLPVVNTKYIMSFLILQEGKVTFACGAGKVCAAHDMQSSQSTGENEGVFSPK